MALQDLKQKYQPELYEPPMAPPPPQKYNPGILENLAHLGGLTGASGLGALLDLPGNIASFIPNTLVSLFDWGLKKAGATGPSVRQVYQKGKEAAERAGYVQPHLPFGGESEALIHKATGGFYAPRGPDEQLYSDFIGTLSNILATEGLGIAPAFLDKLGKVGKTGYQAFRAAGSLGIHKGLKEYPALEIPAQMAFLGASRNPRALAEAAKTEADVFQKAAGISSGKTIESDVLRPDLEQINEQIYKSGAPDIAAAKKLSQAIEETLGKQEKSYILYGKGRNKKRLYITPPPTMASVDDIKMRIKEANQHIYQGNLDPYTLKYVEDLKGLLYKAMDKFHETEPEHGQLWGLGNELHTALTNTNTISKALEKAAEFKPKTNAAYSLLGLGGKLATGSGLAGAGIAAGGKLSSILGEQISKSYDLLSQSPYARKEYINMWRAGLTNDVNSIIKHAMNMDKALVHAAKKSSSGIIFTKGGMA